MSLPKNINRHINHGLNHYLNHCLNHCLNHDLNHDLNHYLNHYIKRSEGVYLAPFIAKGDGFIVNLGESVYKINKKLFPHAGR